MVLNESLLKEDLSLKNTEKNDVPTVQSLMNERDGLLNSTWQIQIDVGHIKPMGKGACVILGSFCLL